MYFPTTALVSTIYEFEDGSLMHLLLRYTQALITQIAQTTACNRHHSLDQRGTKQRLTAGVFGSERTAVAPPSTVLQVEFS